MNEFEKWLEELDSIQVADKFNNQNRAIARCAWKASRKSTLEWALDHAGGACDWDKIEAELDNMKKELI